MIELDHSLLLSVEIEARSSEGSDAFYRCSMLRRGLERMSLEEDTVIEDDDQIGVNPAKTRCAPV